MVTMDEAVIEGFKGGVANHFEFKEAEVGEFSFQWGFQGFDHGRHPIASFIKGRVSSWGKLKKLHPFQSQQDFPTGHVFEVSIGLVPVPVVAQFSGDEFSAPLPIVSDQGLDEGKVIGSDLTSTDDESSFHGLGYNRYYYRTPVKK
jgi:hypothetical protein